MSERIASVAEFQAMKDDSKPFLGNGGSVGKHDTYPPSLQKWSLSSLMEEDNREDFVKIGKTQLRLPCIIDGEECFVQRALFIISRRKTPGFSDGDIRRIP